MRGAALLFAVFAVFYYQTADRYLTDLRYSLLVSRGLWHEADPTLDAWSPPPHGSSDARPVADELPYQLTPIAGHVHHAFPIGTAVLVTPIVGLVETLGYSILDETGAYDPVREARLQHYIASVGMAALVALFFLQARLLLDQRQAAAIAIVAGLATPLWSTGAGTLWTHAPCVALLAIALYLQLRALLRGDPTPPLLLGTLLAWMFFVRPISAISVVALTLHALWVWRLRAWPVLVTGGAWAIAFAIFSLITYDQLLPPYFEPGRLSAWPSGEALLGQLFSPARGLFVYMPALLYLGALLAWRWRTLPTRGLVVSGLAVCTLHWWLISCYPHWWGGHSWGPRLMMDLTPWWVLFTIVASAPTTRGEEEVRPLPGWLRPWIAAVLVGIGISLNAIGVLSGESSRWSLTVDIDSNPERLWDWRDPPFLRWLGD